MKKAELNRITNNGSRIFPFGVCNLDVGVPNYQDCKSVYSTLNSSLKNNAKFFNLFEPQFEFIHSTKIDACLYKGSKTFIGLQRD